MGGGVMEDERMSRSVMCDLMNENLAMRGMLREASIRLSKDGHFKLADRCAALADRYEDNQPPEPADGPGDGWRWLMADEIVIEGDQYRRADGSWVDSDCGSVAWTRESFTHRRRIK